MTATPPVTLADDATELSPAPRAPRPVVLRHRVQYAALRGMLGTIGGLGLRGASALGGRIAQLGYRPLGIRRGVVERQIAAAFPDWDQERVVATARASYENLGRTTIEAAMLSRFDRKKILDLFDEPEGWPRLQAALQQRRGIIVVAGHLGNWELGGAYLAARGLDFEAVARQMENP